MRIQKMRLFASGIALAAACGSAALAEGFDNGIGGGYRRQPTITHHLLRGRIILPVQCGYHSAICTIHSNLNIYDGTFADWLKTHLAPGGNRQYDTLIIHMAQCFTGGMIDELEGAGLPRLSINTASWWAMGSQGREWNAPTMTACRTPIVWPVPYPHDAYSNAWWHEIETARGAGKNKTMRAAYLDALTSATYNQNIRHCERPQYYATDDGMANAVLGQAADKKVALLFVGSDTDPGWGRGRRHYDDAQRMYRTLRALGFPDADITFYYHNGSPPRRPDPGDKAIDGAATYTAMRNYIVGLGAEIKDGDDQVFIWTSDHGTIAPGCLGRLGLARRFVPGPSIIGELRLQLEVGSTFRDIYDGGNETFDPVMVLKDVVIPEGEPPLEMFINNQWVAQISGPTEITLNRSSLMDSFFDVFFEVTVDRESILDRYELGEFEIQVTASTSSPCWGDLNEDRRVDLADLGILLAAFGQSPDGDLNYDEVTDMVDLALLLANLGKVCP